MELFLVLALGAAGGVARGLVGFSKYYTSYKNVKFSWKYLMATAGISALVGTGVAWSLYSSGIEFQGITINAPIAFILGYAGGDVIENLYKILVKKPILGPVEAVVKTSAKKKK